MGGLFSGNLAVQEQSRLLFRCILANQPVTRPLVLSQLNLPPTSLNRALDRLLAAGLIEVIGQADSTGGRPASLFRVRRDARRMLGISLPANPQEPIRLMLLDLALKPIAQCALEWAPAALNASVGNPAGPARNLGQEDQAVDTAGVVDAIDVPDSDGCSQFSEPGAATDEAISADIMILTAAVQSQDATGSGLPLAERIAAAAVDLVMTACPAAAADACATTGNGGGAAGDCRLLGIGIDGVEHLASADRLALQAMLVERLGSPVLCDEGLAGAGFLLARTDGHAADAVALLSLDEPITLVTGNRPVGGGNRVAAASAAAFPVLDVLDDHEPALRPLRELLTADALGHRFARLRDQAALGFPDFCQACQLEKKKAMRLLDASAAALAQAAVGIACSSGLSDIVVSGSLFEALPLLVPATVAKVDLFNHSFGITVRLSQQPFGPGLKAAGIASLVLAQALEAAELEALQA